MTENEKYIQSINRHLNNMDAQQLKIMLIVALELDKGESQDQPIEA